jgi:exopolyphosphatase/guanosine-5'-triphosphate,3'-diphosphate pyrophosphatase
MRIAIIDMGTNTFHLLLATRAGNGYEIIHRDRQAVKLGMGGINQRTITADAADRALRCLTEFKEKITAFGAGRVMAFGTSAMRNAENAGVLVAEIVRTTGIVPQIIPGDLEADYIYKGVRHAVPLGEEKSLIVDIGGGSVEFIIANQSTVFWKCSLEIGAQRLLERFHRHDPIAPADLADLNHFFDDALQPVLAALKQHRPATLVGSSGTFDTLSDIFCLQQGLPTQTSRPEAPLTLSGFSDIHRALVRKNRAERLQVPGMIDMRVDMIVVACCLIRYLLDGHPFQAMRVSTYALKEGVLVSLQPGG